MSVMGSSKVRDAVLGTGTVGKSANDRSMDGYYNDSRPLDRVKWLRTAGGGSIIVGG